MNYLDTAFNKCKVDKENIIYKDCIIDHDKQLITPVYDSSVENIFDKELGEVISNLSSFEYQLNTQLNDLIVRLNPVLNNNLPTSLENPHEDKKFSGNAKLIEILHKHNITIHKVINQMQYIKDALCF